MTTAAERFEKKFMPEPMSGCWLWTGAMMGSGYSYEAHRGAIPENLTIDHKCRTKLCVNPDHMEVVTLEINSGRANGRKTYCKHGHPLSGENLYVRPDGLGRDCHQCRRRVGANRRCA